MLRNLLLVAPGSEKDLRLSDGLGSLVMETDRVRLVNGAPPRLEVLVGWSAT